MRISDWSSDVCSSDLDKHEAVIAELLKTARIEPDYSALAEADKRLLLVRLLHDARPLRVRVARYSQNAEGELAIRSDERRVRKEFVRTGRSRWSPHHYKKKTIVKHNKKKHQK